jgi:hypothetical protein
MVVLSFSLPLRLLRPLVVPLTPFLCISSKERSTSSFLARLDLFELLPFDRDGRCELSLDLGADSDVGEPAGDLLIECDGTERLPERRGSLGDGGGPIVATFAIVASAEGDNVDEEGDGNWGKAAKVRLKQLSR